jgi:hypothetical protein
MRMALLKELRRTMKVPSMIQKTILMKEHHKTVREQMRVVRKKMKVPSKILKVQKNYDLIHPDLEFHTTRKVFGKMRRDRIERELRKNWRGRMSYSLSDRRELRT